MCVTSFLLQKFVVGVCVWGLIVVWGEGTCVRMRMCVSHSLCVVLWVGVNSVCHCVCVCRCVSIAVTSRTELNGAQLGRLVTAMLCCGIVGGCQ